MQSSGKRMQKAKLGLQNEMYYDEAVCSLLGSGYLFSASVLCPPADLRIVGHGNLVLILSAGWAANSKPVWLRPPHTDPVADDAISLSAPWQKSQTSSSVRRLASNERRCTPVAQSLILMCRQRAGGRRAARMRHPLQPLHPLL